MATSPATPCVDHGQTGKGSGYGQKWHGNTTVVYHRLVYAQSKGIPLASIAGQLIRHTCDNPRCINPQHLLVGSHTDNMQDVVDRGRQSIKPALTLEQAREIRRVYVPGTRWAPSPTGQNQLAIQYGVTQGTIKQIIDGKSYKETL